MPNIIWQHCNTLHCQGKIDILKRQFKGSISSFFFIAYQENGRIPFLPNKLRHKGAPWSAIQIAQPRGFVTLQFNNNKSSKCASVWLTHEMNFLWSFELSAPKTVFLSVPENHTRRVSQGFHTIHVHTCMLSGFNPQKWLLIEWNLNLY